MTKQPIELGTAGGNSAVGGFRMTDGSYRIRVRLQKDEYVMRLADAETMGMLLLEAVGAAKLSQATEKEAEDG